MFSIGIPWPDGGTPGMHLAWTGPTLIQHCVSGSGFDIYRRIIQTAPPASSETQVIDNSTFDRYLDALRWLMELWPPIDALGPIRWRQTPPLPLRMAEDARLVRPGISPRVYPGEPPANPPGDPTYGSLEWTTAEIQAALSASYSGTTLVSFLVTAPYLERFTQELTTPADEVWVTITVKAAFMAALCRGKVVGTAVLEDQDPPGGGRTMIIEASGIDTVVIYVPGNPAIDGLSITTVRYDAGYGWVNIRSGLTLPIKEANPALIDSTAEQTEAESRLTLGETLGDLAAFRNMLDALRAGFVGPWLGRAADRILLSEPVSGEPPLEIPFESQLLILTQHPKWRRVLGFGHIDPDAILTGLGAATFQYKVTGHFPAADLNDVIYDVHGVPSGTTIPYKVYIGDLELYFRRPSTVVLAPAVDLPAPSTLKVSRRGLLIQSDPVDPTWLWLDRFFQNDNALVLNLPSKVTDLVLEVSFDHALTYAGGSRDLSDAPGKVPLPVGVLVSPDATIMTVTLSFVSPVDQVLLGGEGILYSVRLPVSASGDRSALTPLIDYPGSYQPPEPPMAVFTFNLQTPAQPMPDDMDDREEVPPRHELGFDIVWLPAIQPTAGASGVFAYWPEDLPGASPLQAIAYEVEHRRVSSTGGVVLDELGNSLSDWEPFELEDNITLGTRDETAPDERLSLGSDLAQLFDMAPHAVARRDLRPSFSLHVQDVFGPRTGTGSDERPLPDLGTYHQYRLLSMDVVGRTRDRLLPGSWAEGRQVQLQKRIPPPQPVGPVLEPPPPTDKPVPFGVKARVVVDRPGLLPEDEALLIDDEAVRHDNVVVLEWGWRNLTVDGDGVVTGTGERGADPYTEEFRVYTMKKVPDLVTGMVSAVVDAGATWKLTFLADGGQAWLQQDECRGQWVFSGGYEFLISAHTATTAGDAPVDIFVEKSALDPTLQPETGAHLFGRPFTRHHRRSVFWDERVAVVPLHVDPKDQNYSYTLYDLFELSPTQPKQTLWVGVSAADGQDYIPDEVTRAADPALLGRPGNESVVAGVTVNATYADQPELSVPPPMQDLPEIVTDEPAGSDLLVTLPLPTYLGAALNANEPISLERCAVDRVLELLSVTGAPGAEKVYLLTTGKKVEVDLSALNPGDKTAIITALTSANPERMAGKYFLYLASKHTVPEEFFMPAREAKPQKYATVQEQVPPKPGRYLYRVRREDVAGRMSTGAAYVPVVVRVPGLIAPPSPEKDSLKGRLKDSGFTGTILQVSFPDDPDITHILLFQTTYPWDSSVADFEQPPIPVTPGELLRIPNRRTLYPLGQAIRVRTAAGTLVAPKAIKALDAIDSDIVHIPTEQLYNVTFKTSYSETDDQGAFVQSWVCTLSRDGIPSTLAGPFGTYIPFEAAP